MLLIFGFTVRMKRLGSVPFFCPSCGGDRTGVRQEARRWFTLFFIPLIPLKVLGQMVQCETCGHRFGADVLDRPTTATLGETLNNAIRALTVMIVAVGDRTSRPLRAKAVEHVGAVAPGYTDDTLETDMLAIDPAHAGQYVQPLADGLAPAGAERFLSDLVRVATAGGAMTDAQRHIIDEAGRVLGLSPAYVLGIVASASGGSAGPLGFPPPSPDDRISPLPTEGSAGRFVPPFEDVTAADPPDEAGWAAPETHSSEPDEGER